MFDELREKANDYHSRVEKISALFEAVIDDLFLSIQKVVSSAISGGVRGVSGCEVGEQDGYKILTFQANDYKPLVVASPAVHADNIDKSRLACHAIGVLFRIPEAEPIYSFSLEETGDGNYRFGLYWLRKDKHPYVLEHFVLPSDSDVTSTTQRAAQEFFKQIFGWQSHWVELRGITLAEFMSGDREKTSETIERRPLGYRFEDENEA